jgi:hypothetical protein
MSEGKQIRDARPGYYRVENDFLDKFGHELGPYGIAVYNALCRFADNETRESYPSIKTLADRTGMSERKVHDCLEQLVALGLIGIESGKTAGTSNSYTVLTVGGMHHVQRGMHHVQTGYAPRADKQDSINKTQRTNGATRPRDELFDAISEVCKVDPATAGASIGKVKSALLKARPPYTPEEVRAFGDWWRGDDFRRKRGIPPTLWQLKEQIGVVRAKSPAAEKPEVEVYE